MPQEMLEFSEVSSLYEPFTIKACIIYLLSANSWNDLNSMYNEQFTLSSAIWTKYIFESFDLGDGQDHIECGVKCEISDTTCNFFLVASDKCHLGRYDYYGSGTVTDSNVPLTYHKQSKGNLITIAFHSTTKSSFFHIILTGTAEPYITTGKFWWYSDTRDWANWIYKYETRAHTRKCSFECFHDDTCDFFVDVHSYCLYGRWAYTGAKIISWTDDVTIYNKIGMINSENLKSVCFSILFFIR